jgi:molecular chaperone GrpE
LRALADYKNLKERTEREKAEFLKFAGEEVIRKLLPVYDSFEMLTKFNSDQGLQVTAKQFQQVLGDLGLEVINVDGEEFDPALMEAVEMVPGEKNKVVEVLQKGFNFRGKLLRVALVKVGNGN